MGQINKEIGQRIRKYREKKGFTQEKFAHIAELHRAYVGQIERGEKNIGIKNLQKISKTLKVKMSTLLGE